MDQKLERRLESLESKSGEAVKYVLKWSGEVVIRDRGGVVRSDGELDKVLVKIIRPLIQDPSFLDLLNEGEDGPILAWVPR